MSEEFYEIAGRLLAAFVVGLLAYLTPQVKAWLRCHAGKAEQEKLSQLVTAFVRAAEQLYHDGDPTGETRSRFVREQLTALGVEVTGKVINLIEGAVWEVNREARKSGGENSGGR